MNGACKIFGPSDYLLCDRMEEEVSRAAASRTFIRNPHFGIGGKAAMPAVLLNRYGIFTVIDFCPFCGGALRGART